MSNLTYYGIGLVNTSSAKLVRITDEYDLENFLKSYPALLSKFNNSEKKHSSLGSFYYYIMKANK
jgi:hypothetical protein